MRFSDVARRKKETSETNYKKMLVNDRVYREEKIKIREQVNVDILKEIKKQVSYLYIKFF